MSFQSIMQNQNDVEHTIVFDNISKKRLHEVLHSSLTAVNFKDVCNLLRI